MAERVKYNSPLRTARAQETRRLIQDAARERFVTRGYGATTIAEIAAAAGVAEQTVYAVFGSKRALLEELVRVGVRGGEGETELARTQAWAAAVEPRDAEEVLRRFADLCDDIYARVAEILEAVRSSRGVDSALAELSEQHDRARRRDLGRVIDRVAALGSLKRELTVKTAGDVLWTLASPEVYRYLVVDRGWSHVRYRRWLGDTLVATLLR